VRYAGEKCKIVEIRAHETVGIIGFQRQNFTCSKEGGVCASLIAPEAVLEVEC
jgi:hypothetical protein